MKIVNIDRGGLQIFWTTWRISMAFSGKMWLMIIWKVTKNQGFTLSLKDTLFEKLQRWSEYSYVQKLKKLEKGIQNFSSLHSTRNFLILKVSLCHSKIMRTIFDIDSRCHSRCQKIFILFDVMESSFTLKNLSSF